MGPRRDKLPPSSRASASALTRAFFGCAKRKDALRAMRLFDDHACSGTAFEREAYHAILSVVEDGESAGRVIRHMREHGVPSNEATLSLEVRALVRQGELHQALLRLREGEAKALIPRKSTFSSLLRAFCQEKDVKGARSVAERMRLLDMEPEEADLVEMIQLMAIIGDDKGLEAQLSALQQMGPRLHSSSMDALESAVHVPNGRRIAMRATVDAAGKCSNCGAQLKSIGMSTDEWKKLERSLLDAAQTSRAQDDLLIFGDWVRRRSYRFIIDGANAAYRNQNYEGGRFSYNQIELLRVELRRLADGAEPLIILPARYLASDRIPNHTRRATRHDRGEWVTPEEAVYVASWKRSGNLWACPDRADDDWYWMYATAVQGAEARVLTNDVLRDHIMKDDDPSFYRFFQRWKHRHIIHFDFDCAGSDGSSPKLLLDRPPSFSHESQKSEAGWHFLADTKNPEMEWLCFQQSTSGSCEA
ncbi:hypothetical protein AB1Y20_021263 [Prymnesium parvum]|uniref:ribonuclease P n=1 Tax=Prymnesium parvum TaxID=97485 RepID=A0AB34JLS7_PRYPA